eukprot:COSAG02_NODE_3500_length_6650_cov_4.876355_5_plen_89_part_00
MENIPHTPPNRLAPHPTWFISLPLEGRAYSVLGWRIWLHRPPKRGAYGQATHACALVIVVLDNGLSMRLMPDSPNPLSNTRRLPVRPG